MRVLEEYKYYIQMADEFYVLAQLFMKGYIASLTFGNAKSVDILATTNTGHDFKVEVKTMQEEITEEGSGSM